MAHVVAVVGNPNCGKTTLFNILTGSTQQVGNWPGVTVEKKVGTYRRDGQDYDLVDLPGIYMIGGISKGSEDERVSRDYILSGEPEVVVNIVDAYNLERNLYLTAQLLEMRVPLVVAVNMMDLAEKSGIHIDTDALSRVLDCPVVPLVASRRKGVDDLKAAIAAACRARRVPEVQPDHAGAVAAARDALAPRLAEAAARAKVDSGWAALKLIEGDSFADALAQGRLDAEIDAHRAEIETRCGEEADIIIADGRYTFIGTVMQAAVQQTHKVSLAMTRRIDKVVLNRFLGVPVFLAAMYLMFLFTIKVGGAFIDFFGMAAEALVIDGSALVLGAVGAPEWLVAVVSGGIGGGIKTVATFVPIIGSLFLFLSFLEDSGYMARAAFVMDRAMRAIGLPGKSFVPLIVGFGCNVPAIMATRTLESRRDRVLTIMMAPFMSCGARLPVYALFAAAFFAESGQNVVFSLYLVGIVFAVGTGLVLKATLLRGEASPFVLELPPYHLPTARTVMLQAWQRLSEFIFRAGQFIVPLVTVLSVLNALGTDLSFGKENSRDSVLAAVSRAITPIFRPIGLTDDNWPAAVGLFTGVFAKEAVVGTLNALYTQVGAEDGGVALEEAKAGIGDKLAAAAATVPQKLSRLAQLVGDPLGLDLSFTGSSAEAAAELKVKDSVFGAMVTRFDGMAGALAYMVLILLYTPCVASLGAIRQEAGGGWTAFAVGWTSLLGYSASVATYQAATFAAHPALSLGWLAACAMAPLSAAGLMWLVARGRERRLAALSGARP
ncbi:fused ferrous iron transporter, protein B: GTP-binding protein; membrane protein [Magnetospirillum sp. XM-1]|uniref:Fe(2+) transporter permease subunit FeoB n=1 Tax=Magnetospirillum sp. XM-1 TaxID=1663591 RepID=UPI00073DB8FB|nr:Fe(2+) transporter permease subunit FeoB [Magnetospirillum sp. XM-1]CUW40595.1 fused ferrous iron transporter, protein B: GTP-binding protein; membrane protein [Magnetospirillum sp. XM-1]